MLIPWPWDKNTNTLLKKAAQNALTLSVSSFLFRRQTAENLGSPAPSARVGHVEEGKQSQRGADVQEHTHIDTHSLKGTHLEPSCCPRTETMTTPLLHTQIHADAKEDKLGNTSDAEKHPPSKKGNSNFAET